jgi:hypothetical protein
MAALILRNLSDLLYILLKKEATSIWREAVDRLGDSERDVDMEQALDIAMTSKMSGYGAQFLALAEAHGVVCISEDKAMKLKAPNGLVRNLEEILS